MAVASIRMEGNGLNALKNVLTEMPKRLPREMAMVANNTAKAHVNQLAATIAGGSKARKKIPNPIAITQKEVKKVIGQIQKASRVRPQAKIKIARDLRPSLKRFNLKQTKTGISYKISKKGKKQNLKSAFVSQKLGGHAYKRTSKKRNPIIKLQGPSVLVMYLKNELLSWSKEDISEEQQKQILRRIRAITVSAIRRQGRVEGLSTEQINQRIEAKFSAS